MPEMFEETRINASKEKVWQILMDFSSYKEWSKIITDVSFDKSLAVGVKGSYTFKVKEEAYKTAPVNMTSYQDGSVVGWGVKKGCLVEAARTFSVRDDNANGCIFVHEMTVHGCLSSCLPTTRIFAMAKQFGPELKARAEKA